MSCISFCGNPLFAGFMLPSCIHEWLLTWMEAQTNKDDLFSCVFLSIWVFLDSARPPWLGNFRAKPIGMHIKQKGNDSYLIHGLCQCETETIFMIRWRSSPVWSASSPLSATTAGARPCGRRRHTSDRKYLLWLVNVSRLLSLECG